MDNQFFSPADVAQAAGVPLRRVMSLVQAGQVAPIGKYFARADAVRLVRMLTGSAPLPTAGRMPLTLPPEPRRRSAPSLIISGALHVAFVLSLIVVASLGLLDASETEQVIKDPTPIHLVYLMTPGPGGGGGGGGLKIPVPPARAERKAPIKILKKLSSPVPPVRKAPPPPKPPVEEPPKPVEPPKIEPPKVDPPKVDPPKPTPPVQTVQAPVVPAPADAASKPGVLNQPPGPSASPGPGTGGGVGTGAGTGMGEGRGSGIGPGSGGGTGGGPFQPGAGIEPPTLLKEVRPLYTDEARRRSISGDVVLEIIVRRDGTVGNLRVIRGLGAGLDEKAIEAVRQWRFSPAKRQGAAVDVVVEVSVEFKLR
jgi:TonB family protein